MGVKYIPYNVELLIVIISYYHDCDKCYIYEPYYKHVVYKFSNLFRTIKAINEKYGIREE